MGDDNSGQSEGTAGYGGMPGDGGFAGIGPASDFGAAPSDSSDASFGFDDGSYGDLGLSDFSYDLGLPGSFGDFGLTSSALGSATPSLESIISKQDEEEEESFLGKLNAFMNSSWGKAALGFLSSANPALGFGLSILGMASKGAQGKGGSAMGGQLGGMFGSVLGAPFGPAGQAALGKMGSEAGANALSGIHGEQGDVEGMQGYGGGLEGIFGSPTLSTQTERLGGYTTPGLLNNDDYYNRAWNTQLPYGGGGMSSIVSPQTQDQGLGSIFQTALPNLLGAVLRDRQAQQMNRVARDIRNTYSQNGAYAQQLRRSLARQDAAAGRRSQYGAREVELQAKLAALASQNAPNLINATQLAQSQKRAKYNNLLKGVGSVLADLFNGPKNGGVMY